jgi:hypothetical protein
MTQNKDLIVVMTNIHIIMILKRLEVLKKFVFIVIYTYLLYFQSIINLF